MHIPFDDDSAACASSSSDSFMEYLVRFARGVAPSSSPFSLPAALSQLPSVESIFRFVTICVLVTVCEDARLMSAAGGMALATVSNADVVAVAVTVDVVAIEFDLPCEFDSSDDCDKPDTVNAETVDAVLSILLNMPLSVSKMNDESRDAIAAFG